MSKIIFIVPPLKMDEIWGELADEGSILPPLGISILASLTREIGFDTKIMDFLAERKAFDKALNAILEEEPQYVGITSTTDMLVSAIQFASAIKKRNKKITILLGGPHISAVPIETMEKFDCFDYGFVGESEATLIDFLNINENNGDVSQLKGLVVRRDGKAVYNGPRQMIENMDTIPFPAWDLLPNLKNFYKPAMINYKREPVTSLVTSRGCVGQCIFCDSSVFGRKVRAYSANYVIKMMEKLMEDYGIKEICFYDDTFVAFKKRLFEICNTIIDKKLDVSWSCNARVNLVDPSMLNLMKKAGCWQIAYGIESGSQRILDLLKKGIKIQQIENAIRWTKEAGISTKGFFIIGNPGETKEDIAMTRQIMLNLKIDDVLIEYFTPYPGTEIYSMIGNYGTFNPSWEGINTFAVNFIPHGMNSEYLKEQFKSLYRSFYFRPRIIFNYLIRLRSAKKIAALSFKFLKFIFAR